jgi:hypothetical protein
MFDLDDKAEQSFLDHDTAIMMALEKTEKGLFDVDETKDEDLEALYEN